MANKENKELAKQRREQERKKAQTIKAVRIVVIIALVVGLIVGLVAITIHDSKKSDTAEDTTGETVQETGQDVSSDTDVVTDDSQTGNLNTTEGLEVKEGDTVAIDYVGKRDGVAFDGGTGSYDLTIGSGTFIDGFEDGLIGHKVGETVDLNLTFPENYGHAELAGADVVFTVTINGIYE